MAQQDALALIAQISGDLNDIIGKLQVLSRSLADAALLLGTETGDTLSTEQGQELKE